MLSAISQEILVEEKAENVILTGYKIYKIIKFLLS